MAGLTAAIMAMMNRSAARRRERIVSLGPGMQKIMLETYKHIDTAQHQLREYQTRIDALENHSAKTELDLSKNHYSPEEKLKLAEWAAESVGTRPVDHEDVFKTADDIDKDKAPITALTDQQLTDYNSRIA